MRHTLTDLARCLWGDEYGPTPACDATWQHEESYFTELLTFAGPDEILDMLRTLCPHLVDGYLPVWVRNLSYRLLLLQRIANMDFAEFADAADGSSTFRGFDED
ncbi:hypothetical protein [Kitasatospora sp. NPDC017646]|uniref:hypothetical protein n=1 Tax=Kitasatospora sp. NPDC017646 TaxID=3364024 RepID=UPI0037A9B05D